MFFLILFFYLLSFAQNKTQTISIIPTIKDFTILPHTQPKCQGITGTCWAFAATSYLESEILRIYKEEIDLSEMFFVYYEYLEKVKRYIETRGKIKIEEGSEAPFVFYTLKKYGCIPDEIYKSKKIDTFYNHQLLIKEIKNFLKEINNNDIWNTSWVINSVKCILNKQMGHIPDTFVYNNIKYTAQSFARNIVRIKPNDYFWFMSTKEFPYYEKHELIEDDNWLNDDNFYNVPIDTFMMLINQSLTSGYTVCLCGDVTEPEYNKSVNKIAEIPIYDITHVLINDNSRTFRLNNTSTTDDHCVHIVGYYKSPVGFYYLIKDSNRSAFVSSPYGYRIYSENYIKLKMMNIIVHKDIAKRILDRIIK
ncbi:MAG: hypothetical protein N3A01_08600 [Bacteroidales bacterium]|nr:hypothetical protein [Bacteroidales bacterium]